MSGMIEKMTSALRAATVHFYRISNMTEECVETSRIRVFKLVSGC